jgi:rsbT co-antagonist protein RsbR
MRTFWNWLTAIQHADEDVRRRSRTLIAVCVALIILGFIALVLFGIVTPNLVASTIIIILALVFTSALFLARQGYLTAGAALLLGILLLVPATPLITGGREIGQPVYFLLAPLVASVILRPKEIWLATLSSMILMIFMINVLPVNPLGTPQGQSQLVNVTITIIVVTLVGTIGAYNTNTALRTADVARDEAKRTATALERSNRDLEQRVAERTAFLQTTLQQAEEREARLGLTLAENEQQRATIREMSVPVIPVTRHTLVMPLIGALDTSRLRLVQEQALRAIERTAAHTLIVDITGVPVVDSQVAQGVLAVMQATRLLGATTLLVGVRPEVAQAIVGLGLDLQSIRTYNDLASALGRSDPQALPPPRLVQPI